jgi:hypothetical protein
VRRLGEALDVLEHMLVDALNDGVGPEAPVVGGPEVVLVPRRAFEPRAVAAECDEAELAATGDEEVLEVWRVDRVERVPLAERRWAVRNPEAQEAGLVPDLNGFNECAC